MSCTPALVLCDEMNTAGGCLSETADTLLARAVLTSPACCPDLPCCPQVCSSESWATYILAFLNSFLERFSCIVRLDRSSKLPYMDVTHATM